MAWLDDISNWLSSLFKQPTKKKQEETTGLRVSQPFMPTNLPQISFPQVDSQKITDWYRTEPAPGTKPLAQIGPTQKATGQVGGMMSTARQVQPMAAQMVNPLQSWLRDTFAPTQDALKSTGMPVNTMSVPSIEKMAAPTIESWRRPTYQAETGVEYPVSGATDISMWQRPTTPEVSTKEKETFGETPAGQSLLQRISDFTSGRGQMQTMGAGVGLQGLLPVPGQGQPPSSIFPQGEVEKAVQGGTAVKTGTGYTQPGGQITPQAGGPEQKMWWEGGTLAGPPTPEQFNTPQYIQGYFNVLTDPQIQTDYYTNGKLNEKGQASLDKAWDDITSDAKDGFLTPDRIGQDPKILEVMNQEMLMRDKYDPKWVETMQDRSLSKVITQVSSLDPTKLPPSIAPDRLNAVKEPIDIATLWDLGYRAPKVTQGITNIVSQIQNDLNNMGVKIGIQWDPARLDTLTYANVVGLEQQLAQMSPTEWQKIIEGNAQITLKTEFWKFNAKGEPVNRGVWDIDYPSESGMSQSDRDRYMDQQRFYNEWYWGPEATAQRNREREESYKYSRERDLEGWKGYYAILDSGKINPDAYEFFSQPGKFAELRRKWETSGAGMTWEAWLAQYDFESEWFKKTPQERGERPWLYNPKLQRLNY